MARCGNLAGMPAVFVHGNPETDAIWGPLFGVLDRDDVVALSPPGFGAPTPDGWTATRREYIDWLATQLAQIQGPIDLVGHDWGGGHVLGLLIEQPDLVRSWCVDVLGILHPDYVWHDRAQVWQTPGAGEQAIAEMVAAPASFAAVLVSFGMTGQVAEAVTAAIDEDMGACVLGLYRDAAQPALAELGKMAGALSARPGLMINAENDFAVGTDEQAQMVADLAGARVVHLAGVGHWWMCQDPAAGAQALETFWETLS